MMIKTDNAMSSSISGQPTLNRRPLKSVINRITLVLLSILGLFLSTSFAATTRTMEEQLARFQYIAAGVTEFSPLKVAVTNYFQMNNQFPSSNAQTGIRAPSSFHSKFVDSVQINNGGVIDVNLANFPDTQNAWLHFIPTANANGQVQWHCESNIDEIEKTIPDCQFKPMSSPQPTDNSSATVAEISAKPINTQTNSENKIDSSGKKLSCSKLQQKIEAKLLTKGVKNYQLTVVDKTQPSTDREVGQCDKGKHKIIYSKNKA